MQELRTVWLEQQPGLILIHGDTTTTLSVSLAAYYQRISIGHIEAGLRTHPLYTSSPDEGNCKVIRRLASWHFAATDQAKANLLAENVFLTGNTVIDALFNVREKIKTDAKLDLTRVVSSSLVFCSHPIQFCW